MQFHNHDRQLISLCEIRKCHAAKNVMQPERAPNRGSFKNAAEHNKYLILIPERITLPPRAYMQFHNHDRQLISLCELQKCHAARESA
jgi:hypothetical protein